MLTETNEETCLEGVVITKRHGDFKRIADETNKTVSHGHQQNEPETRIDSINKLTN